MRYLRQFRGRPGTRWLSLLTAVAVACIVAGSAQSGVSRGYDRPPQRGDGRGASAYVPAGLLAAAQANPAQVFAVVVQGKGARGEQAVVAGIQAAASAAPGKASGLQRVLATISGASATLTGAQLVQLAAMPGVAAITSDDPVKLAGGFSSMQQWPYTSAVATGWGLATGARATQLPAIAVVDSGVDASRPDFAGRVVQQVSLASLPTSSAPDGYGHGTFVSGIAAGSATGYAGAAPSAPIVSIKVLNDLGMARTSDVIAACDWILQHKDQYRIGVANFSLHATSPASVFWDPLDRAVEKLWFAGVTVVTAAGNYAVNGQPSGVLYAPGNDPFVITVGADDLHSTVAPGNDTAAPWSSYGYTYDGFAKPELGAPGRYLIGPVPPDSTLALTRPANVVSPGYMELSGTSFAAPVVSGAAAYLLALHPNWTPDQVKGALMVSATPLTSATPLSEGVGLVDAAQASRVASPPNPNLALDAFLVPDPSGGPYPVFDTAAWASTATSNPSWDATTWSAAAWGTAAWGTAAWGDAAWGDAAWGTAAWGTAAWGDTSLAQVLATAAWGDAAWGTAAWGDAVIWETGPADLLTPQELAAVGNPTGGGNRP